MRYERKGSRGEVKREHVYLRQNMKEKWKKRKEKDGIEMWKESERKREKGGVSNFYCLVK